MGDAAGGAVFNDVPARGVVPDFRSRLQKKTLSELVDIARRVISEYGDDDLQALVGALGARGVDGEMKNLIFAADGPKPQIVLPDSISNTIRIVKNEQYCLVYDQPLPMPAAAFSRPGRSPRSRPTWSSPLTSSSTTRTTPISSCTTV
ncbi:hypothetical protein ACWEWI_36530 [Streptomyces sp. NPDC003753]